MSRMISCLILLISISRLPQRTETRTETISVCSAAALDQALAVAADDATLAFACSGMITLTHPLFLHRSVTLDGTGQNVTLSGDHRLILIEISAHVVVTLRSMTFTAGITQGSAVINYGTLHLNHTLFVDNHHALLSYHRLTSVNDTFSGNAGDAVFIAGKAIISGDVFIGNNRGIDNASAVTTVNDSTFIDNRVRDAGSIGAGIANSGMVYVSDSLFYNNEAVTGGGAIGSHLGGSIVITHTILVDKAGANCFGTVIDGGRNVQFPGVSCGVRVLSADPELAPF